MQIRKSPHFRDCPLALALELSVYNPAILGIKTGIKALGCQEIQRSWHLDNGHGATNLAPNHRPCEIAIDIIGQAGIFGLRSHQKIVFSAIGQPCNGIAGIQGVA